MNGLRDLPSVDSLLVACRKAGLIDRYGHEPVVAALRETLERVRGQYQASKITSLPDREEWMDLAGSILEEWFTPSLATVINATGVILHTNLGRAPLSDSSRKALAAVSVEYNNLEFDLSSGNRGSRNSHARELLRRLTGAGDTLVVNNNAAAVLLALSSLAKRRKVVISRTQLVEIGGGFRIPEVLAQSGAKLLEVGTTNRVALADYEAALVEKPAAILHAHHSNFKIIGFTTEPALESLAALAREHGILLLDDNGSGALLDTARYGLVHEPTVQESLAAGADLVCFSGDKLLGGPQAGILAGKAELVRRIAKHPLMRALRADKLCLAALNQTLLHYLKGEAETQVPVWRMIAVSPAELDRLAQGWQKMLNKGEVIDGHSTVGGGSLPGETLPTRLLRLPVKNADAFLARLRQQTPPVIARIDRDAVVLDPRTVLAGQEDLLLASLQQLLD